MQEMAYSDHSIWSVAYLLVGCSGWEWRPLFVVTGRRICVDNKALLLNVCMFFMVRTFWFSGIHRGKSRADILTKVLFDFSILFSSNLRTETGFSLNFSFWPHVTSSHLLPSSVLEVSWFQLVFIHLSTSLSLFLSGPLSLHVFLETLVVQWIMHDPGSAVVFGETSKTCIHILIRGLWPRLQ